MKFDMNRAWSHATAMVGERWQDLALLAGIFFLLPNLVMVVALPDVMGALMMPAGEPEELAARLQAQAGPLVAMVLVILAASVLGYAAMVSLLGPDRPTVGDALRRMGAALPTLIGAVLVALVGYMLVAFVAVLVAGGLAAAMGSAAVAVILVIAMVVALGWLAVRFLLVTPAIMLEGERGPIKAFARSWRLTASNHARLLGFCVLIFLCYAVISALVSMVTGLIPSLFVTGLVSAGLGAAVAVLWTAIVVAVHQQLAGDVRGTARTFD